MANKDNIRIVVEALRSGRYRQGFGQLTRIGARATVLNDSFEWSFDSIAEAFEYTYLKEPEG